jgi:hypothetical protein
MRIRFRKFMSVLIMIMGAAMLVRGLQYTIQRELGWQGFVQASIVGVLVFALGFSRWRYLSQR